MDRHGPHNKAFGKLIRELRNSKKLSQEGLAFDAGLTRSYISLLEYGKKSPTLDTIVALCGVLDISLAHVASRVEAIMSESNERSNSK